MQTTPQIRRRRLALGLGMAALLAFIVGSSMGAAGKSDSAGEVAVAAPAELPRGGTELLPDHLLVGYYGAPQDEALGALGIGSPAEASAELEAQADAYAGKRPIQPFFELLATVANAAPGEDGTYRTRQPSAVIEEYLAQAREDENLLVLDIQPGRADFTDEVAQLEPYLREPDVGLGLDPEWHVGPDEVPGEVIGSMEASEVNAIAGRMSQIVQEEGLPQKLLIVHRFTADMIANPEDLQSFPGVAIVLNVDGFGDIANKTAKYADLHAARHTGLYSGFKLFYSEDLGLMTPEDVLGLRPRPDLVVYE
ncbi:MAG: hypothetical protein ABIZ50_05730 [Solirubrobacterales bacterium]